MSLVPKGMTCSCCGRLSLGFQCVLFSFLFVSYNANCKSFFMLWQAVSWFFNSLCNVFFSEEDPFSLIHKEPFLDSSKNVFTQRKLVEDSSKNGNRERLDTECVLLHWVLPFTFPGALLSAKVS